MHADKCKLPTPDQASSGVAPPYCDVEHCATMRGVIRHMATCVLGRNCTVAHCGSSKQIMEHYSHCNNASCSICAPLRKKRQESAGQLGNMLHPTPGMAGSVGNRPVKMEGQRSAMAPNPMAPNPMAPKPMAPPVGTGARGDWRANMQPSYRSRLVNKLVGELSECVSPEDQQMKIEGIRQLALRIEATVYTEATTQDNYYELLAGMPLAVLSLPLPPSA